MSALLFCTASVYTYSVALSRILNIVFFLPYQVVYTAFKQQEYTTYDGSINQDIHFHDQWV